jgi:hypothetical protein
VSLVGCGAYLLPGPPVFQVSIKYGHTGINSKLLPSQGFNLLFTTVFGLFKLEIPFKIFDKIDRYNKLYGL